MDIIKSSLETQTSRIMSHPPTPLHLVLLCLVANTFCQPPPPPPPLALLLLLPLLLHLLLDHQVPQPISLHHHFSPTIAVFALNLPVFHPHHHRHRHLQGRSLSRSTLCPAAVVYEPSTPKLHSTSEPFFSLFSQSVRVSVCMSVSVWCFASWTKI